MKAFGLAPLAAALFALLVVRLCAAAEVTRSEGENEWTKADAVIAEHLNQVDPNMRSAIFASALLRKHLSDCRVHVRFDRHLAGETRIFVVNRDGGITPLPNEEWRGGDQNRSYQSPNVAEFLRKRRIRVRNAGEAVEVAQLFEEVQGAANYVAFLHINTKSFTIFDKAFMESQFGPRSNWKYCAAEREGGWRVTVEYVGPPASIQQPPVYEIDLNDQQIFFDLRRY